MSRKHIIYFLDIIAVIGDYHFIGWLVIFEEIIYGNVEILR